MEALIALRLWIWSIAAAAPVIVVLFALWSFNRYGFEPVGPAELVLMGVLLVAWTSSAAAGLVMAVALILRSRVGEALLGLLLSGTSALLFAGAMLLVYFG